MAKIRCTALGAPRARGAIVLLPGFGDRAETFAERGFVAALRHRAPLYDVIAVDAHFGYYRKHCLVDRLHEDVIRPLLREGYHELWLAGTSMGGFGAVGYARTHPENVAGLLLFAPYMGPRAVVEEVRRVGLSNYRPARTRIDDEASFARANFAYLGGALRGRPELPLWLAVGADDRLHGANRLVGELLPADRFVVLPGGHGWKVWTPAADLLAHRALQQRGELPGRD